jgi:hypothetical protein
MACRNDYETLFMKHGISRRELCSMTEVEFLKTLEFFLSEGQQIDESNTDASVASQYRYISPKIARIQPKTERAPTYDENEAIRIAIMNSLEDQCPSSNQTSREATSGQSASYSHVLHPQHQSTTLKTEAQELRAEQNREYREACEEVERRTFDAHNQDWMKANAAQLESEQREEKEAEVISKYYGLPAEPAEGTTIATFVRGKRYIRKFDPKAHAADVYAWVAGQTIDAGSEKLFFDEFELRIAGGGVIDADLALDKQGLKGRVMVQVHEI